MASFSKWITERGTGVLAKGDKTAKELEVLESYDSLCHKVTLCIEEEQYIVSLHKYHIYKNTLIFENAIYRFTYYFFHLMCLSTKNVILYVCMSIPEIHLKRYMIPPNQFRSIRYLVYLLSSVTNLVKIRQAVLQHNHFFLRNFNR